MSEGLKIEADLSTLAYRTEDAEEGMAAFLEKRAPKFKDRYCPRSNRTKGPSPFRERVGRGLGRGVGPGWDWGGEPAGPRRTLLVSVALLDLPPYLAWSDTYAFHALNLLLCKMRKYSMAVGEPARHLPGKRLLDLGTIC